MEKIYLLTDYKKLFGSKHNAVPYQSGMDKSLLKKHFADYNFEAVFMKFSEIDFQQMDFKNEYVLYTSSEDKSYHYKNYIEDIIYGLHLQGARLIPNYKYLRSNNNKVFMEILRDQMNTELVKNIHSKHFGCLEDLKNQIDEFDSLSVIKNATGAMGKGVKLSINRKDLIRKAKKLCRTKNVAYEIKDYLRKFKHKGYIPESRYQKKFIIQNFIPNLKNDWKVLIFGDKYYILYRQNRKNDFRASGSGLFIFKEDIPKGILNYAKKIYEYFNVPNLSLDICFNGDEFYLLEFQAVYFGTTTIEKSPFYYKKNGNDWKIMRGKSILEKEYVNSVVNFIENF